MTFDLKTLTVSKAHDLLVKGDVTAVDLAKAYLAQIESLDKGIHAYLEVFDDVLEQAKAVDEKIAEIKKTAGVKEIPMLMGIPCAVKDNILVKGKVASAGSKMLEKYHATYDATVIARLREQGVVFIGRTNMDEFAMGGSTENSAFGPTHNPHDLSRVPGGTSGGSAAAVAGNMALIALGSDTGGSIRQPSSFCGVVGLKPTYGAVSRSGLIAAVSSLDQIGPITRTVSDAEIVFNAIRGVDPLDSTTLPEGIYDKDIVVSVQKRSNKKPTIGIPSDLVHLAKGLDKDVHEAFINAKNRLVELGYTVVDVDLPNNKFALPVYYIINFAEVSSNLARMDGVKYGYHKDGKNSIDDYFETRAEGFGKEARRRILLGTYVLSSGYYDAYYNRANTLRKVITDDFKKAFEKVDIIMTPTAPTPAYKIGEKISDPVAMYLEDIFTVTANLTGMPAMSVPCPNKAVDAIANLLPIGIQLTARHGDEATLFSVGKDFCGESEGAEKIG